MYGTQSQRLFDEAEWMFGGGRHITTVNVSWSSVMSAVIDAREVGSVTATATVFAGETGHPVV